jgi:pantothenate kinase
LVITEGNYLLLDEDGWPAARREIDEIWYLDPDDDLRVSRLIARHQRFGKDEAAARAWALEIDGANARLVQAARGRANAVVRLTGAAPVAGAS